MFSAGKSNEKKDKDGIVTISTLEKSYAPRPLSGVVQSESTERTTSLRRFTSSWHGATHHATAISSIEIVLVESLRCHDGSHCMEESSFIVAHAQ
jgi:hypothetical protein